MSFIPAIRQRVWRCKKQSGWRPVSTPLFESSFRRTVPYPLPLDNPPVSRKLDREKMLAFVDETVPDASVVMCYCRDEVDALVYLLDSALHLLRSDSIVVIAGKNGVGSRPKRKSSPASSSKPGTGWSSSTQEETMLDLFYILVVVAVHVRLLGPDQGLRQALKELAYGLHHCRSRLDRVVSLSALRAAETGAFLV